MSPPLVLEIIRRLKEEFPNLEIPLQHRSAFELLVAVILSAQCTDARVNQVTPKFFPKDRPLTPQDILDLGEEKLKKIIFPCGYYNSKTKAIMGTSRALLNKEVPGDFESLRTLPGVGAKTAQVVLAQWFHVPAFPVDTHVHRVCNRLGIANSGKNRDKTEKQAKAIAPKEEWSDLHLRLIYHGRQICTARSPQCQRCPPYEVCAWPEKAEYARKGLHKK